jgi:hypothetical protein
MKLKLSIAFLILLAVASCADSQSTTLSGTVTDLGGQSWNSGTYAFSFVTNPAYPAANYTWTGGTLQTSFTGALSSSGTYSVSLPSNSAISPIGTMWSATFCPLATSPCFTTQNFIVQGTTQTFNVTPPAIAINLVNPPSSIMRSYSDGEIIAAVIASQYYNLAAQTLRICQAVSGQTCTTWANVGTGGGGSMTWPSNAGIMCYAGSNAYCTSYTVGTGANDIVQLTGTGALPAVSAANLTNFPSPLAVSVTGSAASLSAASALPNGTTAATQANTDNTTKLATDAFVVNYTAAQGYATGGPFVPTSRTVNTLPLTANITLGYSNFAAGAIANGTTATTQTTGDSSTDVATDAFVAAATANILPSGTQYGATYYATSSALTNLAPPTTQGQFPIQYTIGCGSSSAVAPAAVQAGFNGRSIITSSSTDTVLCSDNLTEINHDVAGTAAVNETLPTPTTLGNTNFGYSYCNYSAYTDQITPQTWTINLAGYVLVPPGTCARVKPDPNPSNATNWIENGSSLVTSAPYAILTDGSTITWAVGGSTSNAEVTLGGNRTLAVTGATSGWSGHLIVKQPASGGPYTLAVPSGDLIANGVTTGLLPLTSASSAIDKANVTYDGSNRYWDVNANYTKTSTGSNSFTYVNSVPLDSTSCGGSATCTLTIPSTVSGNFGVVAISAYSATVAITGTSVTGAGTWTVGTTQTQGYYDYNYSGTNHADNIMAWNTSLTGSATSITITLSSATIASGFDVMYYTGNWSGSTIAFDTGTSGLSTSCTACTLGAISPAGSNEAIIQFASPQHSVGSITGGTYGNVVIDTSYGNGMALQLNSSNGAAPTANQTNTPGGGTATSGYMIYSTIALKGS